MSSDELQDLDGDSLLHSLLLVSKHFGINTNAESLTASLPYEILISSSRIHLPLRVIRRIMDPNRLVTTK